MTHARPRRGDRNACAPFPAGEAIPGDGASRPGSRPPKEPDFAGWSPAQVAAARRWVRTWREAGPRLEQVRRDELRRLDPQRAIALLCGEADYTVPPRAPRPTSGLVAQQRWFRLAAARRD